MGEDHEKVYCSGCGGDGGAGIIDGGGRTEEGGRGGRDRTGAGGKNSPRMLVLTMPAC